MAYDRVQQQRPDTGLPRRGGSRRKTGGRGGNGRARVDRLRTGDVRHADRGVRARLRRRSIQFADTRSRRRGQVRGGRRLREPCSDAAGFRADLRQKSGEQQRGECARSQRSAKSLPGRR